MLFLHAPQMDDGLFICDRNHNHCGSFTTLGVDAVLPKGYHSVGFCRERPNIIQFGFHHVAFSEYDCTFVPKHSRSNRRKPPRR
jgi:hypothetical protein